VLSMLRGVMVAAPMFVMEPSIAGNLPSLPMRTSPLAG